MFSSGLNIAVWELGGKNNTFLDISFECRMDATSNTASPFFFFSHYVES